MTVAFDSFLESATFTTTTPHTFTGPTPIGTPRGALVFITVSASSADLIDGAVTYGGVAMTRVATNGFAVDTAGEPGAVWAYFLGVGLPAGAQTVSISHTGAAAVKWAICHLLTGAADLEIGASAKLEGDQANPRATVNSAVPTVRAAVVFSGQSSVTDLTSTVDASTASSLDSHDYGSVVAVTNYQPAAATTTLGAYGWTAASDDMAFIAVAIQEVAGTVVAPATITTVATLPTPVILAASTVTTAVVPVVASLPTPVIAIAAVVTPAVIAVVTTLPTSTISVAPVVTPAVIAVVTTLPTPSVLSASTVTPAVIPLVVTLPTPLASAPTVVLPAVVAVTAALPTPSILAASKVTPAVIPLAVLLPTPTVSDSASAVATPAVIAASVGLPTPVVSVDAVVTPAGIALVVTIPTPVTTTPGLVTPAGISLVVTLPTPLATVGAITFWTPDPVAFVRVGPGDEPPWN